MDVEVHSKDNKQARRSSGRPSLFGRGMLERARATTLALLGGTTAVGLAMVALALNQGWPLIAGSAIPLIAPQHQDVGKATIAAGSRSDPMPESTAAADQRGGPASRREASRPGVTSPALPAVPEQSADFAVVPSAPIRSHQGQTHGPAKKPQPTQAVQPPQSAAESPAVALPTSSSATPAPPPAAEPPPPDATASEAPDDPSDSNVPSWSHGRGHAYGRDDWDDDDHDWDDDDSPDWDGGGRGRWYGHRHDDG